MTTAQKTPLAQSLDLFTRKRIQDQIQLTGRALPAQVVAVNGAIMTVKFLIKSLFTIPQIDCPLFGPEYIRYPIKPGDMGCVFPSDYYLGGVSGLGGGTADLVDPGNLSALVFFPVGNKTWFDVDPDVVTIYGPNGVVLMDTGAETIVTLTPAGLSVVARDQVSIVTGSSSITMTSTGVITQTAGVSIALQAPSVTIEDAIAHTSPQLMGAAWSALVTWLNTHIHADPQGGNTTAPVVPFSGGNIAPDN